MIMQKFSGRETFHAFADVHEGLNSLQAAVQNLQMVQEIPRGAVDGTNLLFRANNKPDVLMLNGVVQSVGSDYKYENGLLVFTTPPSKGTKITSLYLGSTNEVPKLMRSSGLSTGGGVPPAVHTEVLTDGLGNNVTASSDYIYVTGMPG